MVPLMGSWDLKRDEQFALTNATTYARVRRYRTAVHRADAITFINFPAALLLSAWIPRRSHFDDIQNLHFSMSVTLGFSLNGFVDHTFRREGGLRPSPCC